MTERDPATGKQTRPGHPGLLTDEVQERIVTVVSAGSYLKVAAQHAGISFATLSNWMNRGRKVAGMIERGEPVTAEDERYLRFLEAVTRADTVAEVHAATAWRAAFREDWRAARDYLVRRHPERWAATHRVQISTEESEQRIERAVTEALLALGVDGDPGELPEGLDLDTDGDGEGPSGALVDF